MYSTIRAVSRLIWRICGGNTLAFFHIGTNFACSVCLDLSSLICCSLGRNEGLTLNGSTACTNRRITAVIFLCAWTHIYYLHQEILDSALNVEAPLLTLVLILFICSPFFFQKKKKGLLPVHTAPLAHGSSVMLIEMQHWQANPPLLHLVDRQHDPMIRPCLPLGHLPHPASCCCIVPFTLPFLAQTQQ